MDRHLSVAQTARALRRAVCLSLGWLSIVVAAGVIAAAPASAGDSPGKPVVIKMSDQPPGFLPTKVTVKVGTVVRWKNTGMLVHTVTDDPKRAAKEEDVALPSGAKRFNSRFLVPGKTYRHKFVKPGIYRYFCLTHETAGMVAEVIVKK